MSILEAKDRGETATIPFIYAGSERRSNKTNCSILEVNFMSTINPNVGTQPASLSMPLITPGYPMVSVEKSAPHENATGKNDGVSPETKRSNAVHNSGHDNDRSL
jgi:hypothetical protein